ncbi:MAG: DUF488 domain-containing protein [Ignavibacteriaceae bacterium]
MKKIWTIGHSTRSLDEFIEMLKIFKIDLLADVRSFPGSKRFPQFNKEDLSFSLKKENIDYVHLKELGGRRKPSTQSKNIGWHNKSFQAYADFTETEEFKDGIKKLLSFAGETNTAIMCAEALWWKCHRSIISDYLKAKGWCVIHIIGKEKEEEHPYTKPAKVVQGNLFYD